MVRRQTAYEIAAAMCYLHGKDILHGDLCGGNILLSASSRDERGFIAKVADFGLARNLDTEAIMTSTYGTVSRVSPPAEAPASCNLIMTSTCGTVAPAAEVAASCNLLRGQCDASADQLTSFRVWLSVPE